MKVIFSNKKLEKKNWKNFTNTKKINENIKTNKIKTNTNEKKK